MTDPSLVEVLRVLKELLEVARNGALPAVLSLEEAGRQLGGRHPNTIKRMIRRGELRSVPLGNTQGIPREEIERVARGEPAPAATMRQRGRKDPPKTTAAAIRALAKKF